MKVGQSKYDAKDKQQVRIIEDGHRGLLLCCDEIRGTKHKYVTLKLPEAVASQIRPMIQIGFNAVEDAFGSAQK